MMIKFWIDVIWKPSVTHIQLKVQEHITSKNYVNVLANQFHAIVQTLLPSVDSVFLLDEAPKLTSSRTSFLCTRRIYLFFYGLPQSPDQILSNLCGLRWRWNCVVFIHRYHRYLNLLLFCRMYYTVFLWQAYRKYIFIHSEKAANYFEC